MPGCSNDALNFIQWIVSVAQGSRSKRKLSIQSSKGEPLLGSLEGVGCKTKMLHFPIGLSGLGQSIMIAPLNTQYSFNGFMEAHAIVGQADS